MKILLVWPEYPETFWSFKTALKYILKKATNPPLGLLTVAAMLPREWQLKLVDMNVESLKDKDLEWADYVFMSGILIQRKSANETIKRCNAAGVKIVAGGPLFTTSHAEFEGVDHFVLGEAEITLPPFLEDLQRGRAEPVYDSGEKAGLELTPIPRWDLVKMKKYSTMSIQFSRGCPFDCEFCDITALYGRRTRTKTRERILAELDNIYAQGWRGVVFFVDDNFIGNKSKLKREILPAIIDWMEARERPFYFLTQASIDMSDDPELMRLMVEAGFDTVFVGIETTNEDSLVECKKYQNQRRDLLESVKRIQRAGMQVQAGFIVGFDNDPVTIFEGQIKFIQESGIVTAMVGLLNAGPGTKLYSRMEREGRLFKQETGDNTDCSINFIPKMDYDTLIAGYKKIMSTIYSPKVYYERVRTFLRDYKPSGQTTPFRWVYVGALSRAMFSMGIIRRGRIQYWKLFLWTLFKRPRLFPMAATYTIYGLHFRKVCKAYL